MSVCGMWICTAKEQDNVILMLNVGKEGGKFCAADELSCVSRGPSAGQAVEHRVTAKRQVDVRAMQVLPESRHVVRMHDLIEYTIGSEHFETSHRKHLCKRRG